MQQLTENPVLIENNLQASLGMPGSGTLRPLLLKLRRRCTEPVHQELLERLLDGEIQQMTQTPGEMITFPSGWCGFVLDMLKNAGMEVQYHKQVATIPGGLKPEDLPPSLVGLVNGFSAAPRGQAVLVGSPYIVPSLGALFRFLAQRAHAPLHHMLVACRSNALKHQLASELKAIMPASVGVFTDQHELDRAASSEKIFVANAVEFESAITNPDAWNVYVVVEARLGRRTRIQTALQQRPNIPRYCLRLVHEDVQPGQELEMAAVFGRILFEPPQQMTRLEIAYPPTGPSHNAPHTVHVRDGHEAATFKREHIWLNPQRNQHIAAIVTAIETKNEELLTQLCTNFDKATIASLLQSRDMSIAVENKEQGEALLKLLPGWKLKTRAEAPAPETEAENDAEIEEEVEIPTAALNRCLVTETWLADGRLDTQLVIRVGGWPGNLDNSARSTRQHHLTRWLLDLEEPRTARTADHATRPKVIRQPRQSERIAASRIETRT